MSTYGEPIDQRVFDRLNAIERKKISKQIDDNRPNQIYRAFPDDKIMAEDTAIRYLIKETGLDEGTVIKSVNTLIKDSRFVTARDTKQRLHLRKNKFA